MTLANYSGSDLSGSSGDLNRVLTLSNTENTLSDNFFVYVSGLLTIEDTDFTVTHNSASSTVAFLKPLYDDMTIIVIYHTASSSTSSSLDANVVDRAIARYGENVTLTVITPTYSDYGDISSTSTSTSTITVVHNDIGGDEEFNKEGRYQPGDKVFFCKSSTSNLSLGNTITFNETDYEIKDVITHRTQGSTFVFEIRCSKVL